MEYYNHTWNIYSQLLRIYYTMLGCKTKELHNLDIDEVIKELKINSKISLKNIRNIISAIKNKIKIQPNILNIAGPVTVVGDIHGQFYDLLNIFGKYGSPPEKKYLFLGDYVDRGAFNIEVMTILLIYKLKYPQCIHLLRGNHESRSQTTIFNFRAQCLQKYNQGIYDQFMHLFDDLPISAIINDKIFAVHAGISPHCQSLEDIQKLNRFRQVPQSGGLCDLLWSDPLNQMNEQWQKNIARRCSFYFGLQQAKGFLSRNNLKMIIRGHEVNIDGFKYQNHKKVLLTLTIFSAPNYGGIYKNQGCIAEVKDDHSFNLRLFRNCQIPKVLPCFKDAFQMSLPVISQSVQLLLKHLCKSVTRRWSKAINKTPKGVNQMLISTKKRNQSFSILETGQSQYQNCLIGDKKDMEKQSYNLQQISVQNRIYLINQQVAGLKSGGQYQIGSRSYKQKKVIGPKLNFRRDSIKSFR